MFRNLISAGIALAVLTCAVSTQASDRPGTAVTVTFGENTVTASGITQGKSAIFFGVGFFGPNDTRRLVRWKEIVSDDDGDGTVILSTGDWPLTSSIWVVVDLESGRYAVTAPPGSAYNLATMPRHPLLRGRQSGEVDRLSFDHPLLEMLYVDPGHGAWVWSARDGSPTDKDGPNGHTTVDLADGTALAGSGSLPKHFASGGVLIAIDWYKRDILATPIADSDIQGAQ